MRDRRVVPVPMFHSVGLEKFPWCWNYLSLSVEVFEGFLKRLSRAGFRTIGLTELQAHMRGETPDLRDAVVLTFDDGYLDNWVYVAPLLRRYGMRGTVFVTHDFIDPAERVRLSLDDVWRGSCSFSDLRPVGFMNWAELRQLDGEGILDVQSHAMTHTWHFTGPEVIDWHKGERHSQRPWLAWNARPDRKPYYLAQDQSSFLPIGHPVFENRQALVARKFQPDGEVVKAIHEYVQRHGGREFFGRQDWAADLRSVMRSVSGSDEFPGSYETEAEHEGRMRYEIARSRELIGDRLGKRVDFICWPAGGSDSRCEEIAREVGYVGWTLKSSQEVGRWNAPGEAPEGIVRVGASRYVDVRGKWRREAGPAFLLMRLLEHQRSPLYAAAVKAYKFGALLAPDLR